MSKKIGIKSEKKVTVLLALYNGSKFIEAQLDSLLEQTRKIDQVLIGDDRSNDGSFEIVQQYIAKHHLGNCWSLQQNKVNRGHAGNFINLCYAAEGDYVFFCDQDDIWMPEKVELMLDIMESNLEIQFLYADVINTNQPESRHNQDISSVFDKTIRKIVFSAENFFFKGLGCATCIRGGFLKQMLPYWTEGWEHDMFFWACAIMTDSGYQYNYPVIWRRIHENNVSISDNKTLEKRIKQVEQSLIRPKQLRKLLVDEGIVNKKKKKFVAGYEEVLKRRNRALKRRNPFLAAVNMFGRTQYFLHKKKGVILDIVLIVFKKYPVGKKI